MQVSRESTGHRLFMEIGGLRMLERGPDPRMLKKIQTLVAVVSILVLVAMGLVYWAVDGTQGTDDTVECERVYPVPACAEMGSCTWSYQSCSYEPIKGK